MRALILGGARSGKSHFAEQWAEHSKQAVEFIATAKAEDPEMEARIAQHREDRPKHWNTHEIPIQLADSLTALSHPEKVVIVDCLTLWLTNLLCADNTDLLKQETKLLLETLPKLSGTILFVSNEVGLGVIPMGELTRRYVDEAGYLHQALAKQCDSVILMVAGLPHYLKGKSPWTG